MKSVTDSSWPDLDFETNSYPYAPKQKDSDECFDEDGNLRRLGKYNAPGFYGPEYYPSAKMNFYRTPFTTPENHIYWIQADERQTKCPSFSWLAYDNSKCQTESKFDIDQVGLFSKTFWKLAKVEDEDEDGTCYYYTIGAWDPSGFEQSCSS
jgi:hypothetical protein